MAQTATTANGPSEDELARAIALYRGAMPEGALSVFDIGPLDRLGLAVFVATYAGEAGFVNDGFGYGATPEEALVGALGEISETAHLDAALRAAPVEVASFAEMTRRHGAGRVIDPLRLCLPAGSGYAPDAPLAWTRVARWPDGEEGFAPLEAVAAYPPQWQRASDGATRLFRPITCGLGAGTSRAMALAHGILENLQRDGNCTAYRAMDRGRVIEVDAVRDPALAALLDRLRGQGLDLQVKLALTEFGMTNLYVQGTGAEVSCALAQTACGEAVHPSAERALRKAALEFVASRARKLFMHGPLGAVREVAPAGYLEGWLARLDLDAEEPRALAEMARWAGMDASSLVAELRPTMFREAERVPFSRLPTTPEAAVAGAEDRLAHVAGRLAAEGVETWVFDASPPGEPGVRVTRAINPTLEGETMSYHRIGERGAARLLAAGSEIVAREGGGGRLSVRLTAEAEERLGGPVWLDAARVDAIVGGAYPLYREPSSHAAQVAAGRG